MAIVVLAGAAFPPTTDISAAVQVGTLRIENSGGSQLATCAFDVVDKAGTITVLVPENNVKVTDGGTTIFCGLIKNRVRLRAAGDPYKRYTIQCQDFTSLLTEDVDDDLNPRTATESDKTRIEYLLTTYGTRGVTGGTTVQTLEASMPEQTFTAMTLYEAIQEVAKLTGGSFYVGFDKALHYFSSETNPSSWDFSDTPNGSTTFPYRQLVLPDDTIELVNAVFVLGSGASGWVTDATSIATYGRREGAIRDSAITTAGEVTDAGNAYLAQRAYPRQPATITYRKAGLVAGMTVKVTDARWGLSATQFTVAKVTAHPVSSAEVEYEAQLTDGVIDLAAVIRGPTDTSRKALVGWDAATDYATKIMGRVKVVDVLPTLPDTDYPIGQLVFYTVDEKIYRNPDDVAWTRAISGAAIADGGDVLANTITAGAISAGAIGAEALAAKIVLASKLVGGVESGCHVEIDQYGVRLYNASLELMVNVPTDGSEVYVRGKVVASSLAVSGNASFGGTANTMEPSSKLTLTAGVNAPTVAPTVTHGYYTVSVPTGTYQPYKGLSYDAAGGAGGATKVFWSVSKNQAYICEILCSDRTVNRTKQIDASDDVAKGVCRHGSYVYVTYKDTSAGTHKVRRFLASDLSLDTTYSSVSFPASPVVWPTIGSDGTYLYIADVNSSDYGCWNKYDSAMVKQGSTITTDVYLYDGYAADIDVGSFDFGSTRVVLAGSTTTTYHVCDPSTGAENTAESWWGQADTQGVTYGDADGTGAKFWGCGLQPSALIRYTGWYVPTNSYWVSYSWYDSVAPTHETAVSPRTEVDWFPDRSRLEVTCPPIQGTDVDNHRVYMVEGATDPGVGNYWLQATMSGTTTYLYSYTGSGTHDGTGTAFPSGTPAEIRAASAEWWLKADGSLYVEQGYCPSAFPLGWSATDTHASSTGLVVVSGGLGGARAVPLVVAAPMKARTYYLWNTDTASERTAEVRLYKDVGSDTLQFVTGTDATFSFTPTVAARRSAAMSAAPVTLTPGIYWLVIRNTSTLRQFGLGYTYAADSIEPTLSLSTSTAAALGSTIDVSAWTESTAQYSTFIGGDIFNAQTWWGAV